VTSPGRCDARDARWLPIASAMPSEDRRLSEGTVPLISASAPSWSRRSYPVSPVLGVAGRSPGPKMPTSATPTTAAGIAAWSTRPSATGRRAGSRGGEAVSQRQRQASTSMMRMAMRMARAARTTATGSASRDWATGSGREADTMRITKRYRFFTGCNTTTPVSRGSPRRVLEKSKLILKRRKAGERDDGW
jgi:hypothetical protein